MYDDQASVMRMFRTVTLPTECALPALPLVHTEEGTYCVVSHLFSGRRRENDVHDYLIELAQHYLPMRWPLRANTGKCRPSRLDRSQHHRATMRNL